MLVLWIRTTHTWYVLITCYFAGQERHIHGKNIYSFLGKNDIYIVCIVLLSVNLSFILRSGNQQDRLHLLLLFVIGAY